MTRYTAEDIRALIEVMEDDLFDDLLNHVSHAQTASDIVDGMEESIWAQGDKLSEKLIFLLFPNEKERREYVTLKAKDRVIVTRPDGTIFKGVFAFSTGKNCLIYVREGTFKGLVTVCESRVIKEAEEE